MPLPPKPLQRRPANGWASAAPGQQAGSPPAPAQTPAQQQAAQQQRPVGTGFVDLTRILDANRAGAQQMGQKLDSQVSTQGQSAKQGIQGAQQAFNNATAEKTLSFDAGKAPTAQDAARLAATVYSGPKDWGDAGVDVKAVTAQTTQANDAANAIASAGGRAALLREGGGNFTTGGSMLDAALSGAALGQRALDLRKEYGGLSEMLKAARGEASGAFDKARQATADAAGKYGALAGQLALQEARADGALDAPLPPETPVERDERLRDTTGNVTTIRPGGDSGTWEGSDGLLSGGRKGPRNDIGGLSGRRSSR